MGENRRLVSAVPARSATKSKQKAPLVGAFCYINSTLPISSPSSRCSFGTSFPFHTLFENVSGSLLMGLLAGYFMLRGDISQHLRLFLTTGILGGYTTFSAFSLDAILLWERQQYGMAALYVFISVIASLAGLMIGLAVIRLFNP
jgi:fluoride exporter